MTILVSNQQPAVLDAVHTISVRGDYDPMAAVQATLADPIQQPLNASAPVQISDALGNDLTGDITKMVLDCLGDTADPRAEGLAKELFGKCLVHFDQKTPLPIGELFTIQSASRLKLPAPSPRVIYSARNDVIPSAKALLAGSSDADALTVSLAFTYHPDTLGFWFQSAAAFDDFTAWLATQVAGLTNIISGDTLTLFTQLTSMKLKGLSEALVLRKDNSDNNEEYSFARLLVFWLMTYINSQSQIQAAATAAATATAGAGTPSTPAPAAPAAPTAGLMPFSIGELFCPRTIVLVNVESHARATPGAVDAEWRLVTNSLANPVKVVSRSSLSKLTALPRHAAKAKAQALRQQQQDKRQQLGRSAAVKFRAKPPTKVNIQQHLNRVLSRMTKVNQSQNILRTTKSTFARSNRRNPDDYNRPGRTTSLQYLPDLHVYVDTSGSISEANYQDTVMMLIQLARKMNVDLYFNSFSHVLSSETLLRTRGKSTRQIWAEFRKIPKVSGGTNYQQIWQYINDSPKRRRRLSLVITDFEWVAPALRVDHPKNIFYAPCSSMDWDQLVQSADRFSHSMMHIDPTVRQRLLGMVL